MLNHLKSLLPPVWWWHFYADEFYRDQWQHQIFPQHYWLLRIISQLKPKNILEAGCGFGRNLKFLIEQGIAPRRLTGIDFSSHLLRHINLPGVKLQRASAQKLPFPANQFDLVFTHGLLMHLPPSQIHLALSELVRVTHHYLVVIEETRKKPGRINHFTWAHDYPKLIAAFNLKILDYQYHGKHNLVWYLLQKT